jgi:haloalkane dehalogenase
MELLRTPDDRFVDLPEFPFEPHYVDVADPEDASSTIRVHHLDEGPANGPVVVLMHGEPSWCFLYRTMIPVLVEAGFRCIAPDLVGFGRSDKPASRDAHTYARHVEWMRAVLFDRLELRDITLFAQDWGGLIGLRLVAEHPDRFSRVVVGNTGMGTGDRPPQQGFLAWQRFSQETPKFDVGGIIAGSCSTALSAAVVAAYDAPFPDESFKEGPRMMPTLVPTSPDDPASDANRRAWESLGRFDKPFLTAFSDGDPITAGGERSFQHKIPGAIGQPHVTIEGAGHFLQEDRGPEIARVIVQFIASN